CENKVDAREVPIGYVPYAKDINIEGLDITEETVEELLTVDRETWIEEAKGIEEFYAQFGDRLPKELEEKLADLKRRLG
ncbi:MAG: phosphoenolpyruvate carboxykinase (GTP), partial [Clostridia bacterium]|nr:phosphoenolpyruvate carboxykinase (GTP) [Clostridia bacterium]